MLRSGFRGLFGAVAAISAAALADPLVEAASNAGLFGRGNYTDHSSLDVLPALAGALVLAALYVFLRTRALVTRPRAPFARLRLVPMFPAIFGAQLGALFAMETLEQIAVAGHPLGGALWLGAPVGVALALHGGACILTVCALTRALDAATRTAAGAALLIRAIFVRRAFARVRSQRLHFAVAHAARPHPLAARGGKRAPPFLAAFPS